MHDCDLLGTNFRLHNPSAPANISRQNSKSANLDYWESSPHLKAELGYRRIHGQFKDDAFQEFQFSDRKKNSYLCF